jgi:hypothetical protein
MLRLSPAAVAPVPVASPACRPCKGYAILAPYPLRASALLNIPKAAIARSLPTAAPGVRGSGCALLIVVSRANHSSFSRLAASRSSSSAASSSIWSSTVCPSRSCTARNWAVRFAYPVLRQPLPSGRVPVQGIPDRATHDLLPSIGRAGQPGNLAPEPISALERQHLCRDLYTRTPEHVVTDLLHGLAQAFGARDDIAREHGIHPGPKLVRLDQRLAAVDTKPGAKLKSARKTPRRTTRRAARRWSWTTRSSAPGT